MGSDQRSSVNFHWKGELKNMSIEQRSELAAELVYVEAALVAVDARSAADGSLTDEDQALWNEGEAFVVEGRARLAKLEAREALLGAKTAPVAAPAFIREAAKSEDVDTRSASAGEIREAAMRAIEKADDSYLGSIGDARADALEAAISAGKTRSYDGEKVARALVAQSKPAYESAFVKGLSGRSDEWSHEERQAVSEARAQNIGTDSAGGFGVPIIIDPTILITNGQTGNPLINAARVEAITNDEWKGVSAAQAAWSMDAEAAQVSDDSVTLAQPTIKTEKPQAFIPYSIEVGMDYPGFASEMGRVLAQGYTYLVANQLAVGDGSTPNTTGIFTGATTTIYVATDNTFVAADIDAVYAGTPEDFRAAGQWIMNVDVENEIRAFGSGTATSRFTVDQTRDGITLLNGKPVILTDHAPAWSATDGQDILVFGDTQNFVLAQRLGMTLDTIPHLMGANQRPTGQRGLYGYARFGSGVVVANAFRKLKNITT